ncbi:hypothetical protein JL37_26180 [Achromobacter sp. RTa]|uniref:hypothetical protein n=1 Tax=Achromobacter sp. RTa TaxID=1532557 RepID=UPI00050FBDA8|nr:hypothetical protein [Achromobacter sp. RTa]KGD88066.1 hypothetical protein JL37_26180 [Achromobacter sp. RTa]
MNDKNKTWRSTTTTRSWSSSKDLGSGHGENFETLLDGATVSETWSYSGDEDGEPLKVEIKNGAVTLNGRKYDSLDAVPRAQRERIEALRAGEIGGDVWQLLRQAGIDVNDLAPAMREHAAKPAFSIETEGSDPPAVPAASTPPADAAADASLPPGAVPAGGGLRRMLLIGIAVGLGWWVARALNLF